MVSAFDGRTNDPDESRRLRKSETTMTSDPSSGKKTPNKNSTGAEKGPKDVEGDPRDTARPRTPIVTGPIIELRGREVVFAIGVFFLFAIVVGLVVVLASNRIKDSDAEEEEELPPSLSNSTSGGEGDQDTTPGCPTPDPGGRSPDPTRAYSTTNCSECRMGTYPAAWVLAAASVLLDMDPGVDPCEDFWTYSCGGWLDRVEIPESMGSVGVDWELERRIRKDIRSIVEGPQWRRTDPESAERKFRDLYDSCMDTGAIDALGPKPLLDIVNRFGGWAFLPDWNLAEKSGGWSTLRVLAESHFTFEVNSFFSVSIAKDGNNSSDNNILQFSEGGLGLSKRSEYFRNGGNTSTVRAYKRYMATVAKLFGATDDVSQEFAESTFATEHSLATLHSASEHSDLVLDPMQNSLRVGELQEIAPRINWTLFLRSAFPKVTQDTVVLVTNVTYMANVSSLITNSKESDVSNYLLWRLTSGFASVLLSEPFRDAHNAFKRPQRNGLRDTAPRVQSRQSFCQELVGQWFGHALSAEYVRRKNFTNGITTEILDLIRNIKTTFRQILEDNEWMDNSTKTRAMEKLDAMRERIGYPPVILNDTELDEFYYGFEVKRNESFFSNILRGLLHRKQKRTKAMELNIQSEDWSANAFEANAFYSLTENIFGLTIALLQKPFYDEGAPNYVNYAKLGFIVAHEMVHGFDARGAAYDREGKKVGDWWTNNTLNHFSDRIRCISGYYDNLLHVGDAQVNREYFLNEHLADIGGLKIAYEAYKTFVRNHNKGEGEGEGEGELPGLQMTNEEVFFVAFAQNLCKSRRKERARQFTSHSNEAIEGIRVRGTVFQMEEFSSIFGCSSDVATNKCHVW